MKIFRMIGLLLIALGVLILYLFLPRDLPIELEFPWDALARRLTAEGPPLIPEPYNAVLIEQLVVKTPPLINPINNVENVYVYYGYRIETKSDIHPSWKQMYYNKYPRKVQIDIYGADFVASPATTTIERTAGNLYNKRPFTLSPNSSGIEKLGHFIREEHSFSVYVTGVSSKLSREEDPTKPARHLATISNFPPVTDPFAIQADTAIVEEEVGVYIDPFGLTLRQYISIGVIAVLAGLYLFFVKPRIKSEAE